MSSHAFTFHGLRFEARASGALWWPDGRWLVVADLHFGKSERLARRGGPLLPPYEGLATLERLGSEIATLRPETVVSLGDGFDDMATIQALDPAVLAELQRMATMRDWFWISGNHDPLGDAKLPGRMLVELPLASVILRHQADPQAGPDISGHFHPVVRLAGERRRAFLLGKDHLILPAFGAYTGGLSCEDASLRRLIPKGIAIACGRRAVALPIGVAPAKGR